MRVRAQAGTERKTKNLYPSLQEGSRAGLRGGPPKGVGSHDSRALSVRRGWWHEYGEYFSGLGVDEQAMLAELR